MEPNITDVIAVVGACAPERGEYARQIARQQQRTLFSAQGPAIGVQNLLSTPARQREGEYGKDLVAELPLQTRMTDLIGALADNSLLTQLSHIVCIVDAAHLLSDLFAEEYVVTDQQTLWELRHERTEYVARAQLIVQQIEYATTVVVLNWQTLPQNEVQLICALISHLGPHASLHLEDGDTLVLDSSANPYSCDQTRPGWLSLLNHDFNPRYVHPSVVSLRYEQPRPFHPGRLQYLLDHRIDKGDFGRLVRSSGFCRLATRPHITAQWEHVGSVIGMLPLAYDHQLTDTEELLAIGQDIALTGLDLDVPGLTLALDRALLTNEEFCAGPALWTSLEDPFPAWTPQIG